jgi:hypothetical protein
MYDMTLTMGNKSDSSFEDIINDILSHDNVMLLSVKSSGAVCEVNTQMNLPSRISDQYAAIGDQTRPWHIRVNLLETKEGRFIVENKTNGGNSYSIRFFDPERNLVLRANFVQMYDSSNNTYPRKTLCL